MALSKEERSMIRIPFACTVYYSDGQYHASGATKNVSLYGGCVDGSAPVEVGTQLSLLLIPALQRGLMITNATVRWVNDCSFGVSINQNECRMVTELEEE